MMDRARVLACNDPIFPTGLQKTAFIVTEGSGWDTVSIRKKKRAGNSMNMEWKKKRRKVSEV